MATLAATLRNLTMGGEDAMHRADRAQIDAFIQQGGIDLGRGLIREAGRAQVGKHLKSLIPCGLTQVSRWILAPQRLMFDKRSEKYSGSLDWILGHGWPSACPALRKEGAEP
jgi:hypothetical protein